VNEEDPERDRATQAGRRRKGGGERENREREREGGREREKTLIGNNVHNGGNLIHV
jgi:hypothetical protein